MSTRVWRQQKWGYLARRWEFRHLLYRTLVSLVKENFEALFAKFEVGGRNSKLGTRIYSLHRELQGTRVTCSVAVLRTARRSLRSYRLSHLDFPLLLEPQEWLLGL